MNKIEIDKFKDECGVFGIYSKSKLNVASITYYGLYALQHRGEESSGIVISDGKKLTCTKGMGLVSDVFNEEIINNMKGKMAIGHVRYSTFGESTLSNAQPLLSSFKLGSIAIAHNGTLVNAEKIKSKLEESGLLFQTSIDSEVILNLIARSLKTNVEESIKDAMKIVKGSYGIVILTEDKLIGVRDPNGIRPLCIGKIENNYVICSESCALHCIGAEFIRDVEPGEMVIVDENGLRSTKFEENVGHKTCAFEYIYFARPDSKIDGINVYNSRVAAGEQLFKEAPADADIVIGVPDSGIPAAVGYAKASGIPYGIGLVKNKYVGRTFIAPSQDLRERAVSVKLSPLKVNVEGKRIVLIDDSIVRGTTSRRLVEVLKRAGAKEIHFRLSSPVVTDPCYFGIATPYKKDLIGANMSVDEICKEIGADSLGYLSIDGLLKVLKNGKDEFCLGCFNGQYPVER
ncbi:amidophosphoribosyltransferase [Clostridium massiliodielmoense]|uniref:amidophosphoribosyltransferase n=1 Tax=Clostridium massiliodielmoense TaxID=1776385 RepID=UPI000A2721A2|nr:amidophosphoribosyltransferase [Clostridium massiliodielmoense]